MMKLNIGKVAVHTPEEAEAANACVKEAIASWTGMLFRTQAFIDLLPSDEDDVGAQWTAPEDFVEIGDLALYDDAYIIPFFESLLEVLDARTERGLVFSVSEELRAAYDAQWKKISAAMNSMAPKVTGPMARSAKRAGKGGSKMTDKHIWRLYEEAANYTDPDAFASDAVLSLLDPDDPGQEVEMASFDQLRTLWHVANDSFKALLTRIGLNQTQCAIRFCIPLRTVQGWAGEQRTPPPYLRLMMAEATGVLDLRERT